MKNVSRILAVLVLLVTAAFASTQQLSGGVSVNAPLTLTTSGPEQSTTEEGKSYTRTLYEAAAQNDDVYMVAVAQYPFELANTTLDDFTKGFLSGIGDGKILSSIDGTVSGLPAKSTVFETTKNGRVFRIFVVVTYSGSKAYIIAFGTWMDTQGTDPAVVKTFFQSISIQ